MKKISIHVRDFAKLGALLIGRIESFEVPLSTTYIDIYSLPLYQSDPATLLAAFLRLIAPTCGRFLGYSAL
jgi:hypothetical protein